MSSALIARRMVAPLIVILGLALVVPAASAQTPGAFSKISPANGATGVPTSPTISWGASSNTTSYEYCVSVTGGCSTWTSAGAALSAIVNGLGAGVPFSWQVRAINASGTTYANGSMNASWTFTTAARPGAFNKSSPPDLAVGQPTSLTLTWGASSNATSYDYCYDTTNDGLCSTWTSVGTALSVGVSGLTTNTVYSWQVRANNAGGTTYANGDSTAFWTFTPQLAVTLAATGVTSTGATLRGLVNPNGTSTTALFEYGPTTSYGSQVPASPAPGSGTSPVAVSAAISGLLCGRLYHFRVGATNTSVWNGSDATFTTTSCNGLVGSVQALAVDPVNGQAVYAGTTNGIYKTANRGTSWTRIDAGLSYTNVRALAIRPDAPCTIFAGIDTDVSNFGGWPTYTIVNSTGVLALSNDCGATWGVPFGGPSGRLAGSVAFSFTSPSVLYTAIVVNDATCFNAFPTGFCIDLLKGSVARVTPSASTQLVDDSVIGVVATDPANACTAYYGRSSSVYQNTSCAAWNWTVVGAAFSGTVNAIAVHPTNQATLLAGTGSGQIYRKLDSLSPWVSVATVTGSINSLVYEPGNPLVAYAAGSGGVVYKTIDGGSTWSPAATIGSAVSSLAIGAGAPTSVYAGGNSFVVNIGSAVGQPPFTDDPLTAGSSVIRAVHVAELRTRIDAARARSGLAAYSWTDPQLVALSTIKAVHITELRLALAAAYLAAGRTAPTYTDPSLGVGTTMKVAHIAEIRTAVIALE